MCILHSKGAFNVEVDEMNMTAEGTLRALRLLIETVDVNNIADADAAKAACGLMLTYFDKNNAPTALVEKIFAASLQTYKELAGEK